jgi:hypothetical protein
MASEAMKREGRNHGIRTNEERREGIMASEAMKREGRESCHQKQ